VRVGVELRVGLNRIVLVAVGPGVSEADVAEAVAVLVRVPLAVRVAVALGGIVAVAVAETVAVADARGVSVPVAVAGTLPVTVAVAVGEMISVGVRLGLGVSVAVRSALGVDVALGAVPVDVAVAVWPESRVAVGVAAPVIVGCGVADSLGVALGEAAVVAVGVAVSKTIAVGLSVGVAGQPRSATDTAVISSLIVMAPLPFRSPFGQREVPASRRAMSTSVTSSAMVTWPLPSQSPGQAARADRGATVRSTVARNTVGMRRRRIPKNETNSARDRPCRRGLCGILEMTTRGRGMPSLYV
jgi:hypothetical protein